MILTPAQKQAIEARGNVLVMAGAGTGKTGTLVERCLDCLRQERPRVGLDEMLLVTFTEAAAAEMRQRIREGLSRQREEEPAEAHWAEQLALFETAHMGTLHSFCLKLVRQHFYELGLDPQLTVVPEEEARLLAEETLDELLRRYYRAPESANEAVQALIQSYGRGGDKPIRHLILKLHDYAQTLPGPENWITAQSELFRDSGSTVWRGWLELGIEQWREQWQPALDAAAAANDLARQCADALRQLRGPGVNKSAAAALQTIADAEENCPRGKKKLWREPLRNFFKEARFLVSLSPKPGNDDPLAEDWNWVRKHMGALLQLAAQFAVVFTETKRELGAVDFHDLEQFTLRLLWDQQAQRPTRIAREWRRKLRFIFVDEYQDINAVQDRILDLISREGTESNRCLVGDVKQSIYRFRLADPRIFQTYVRMWANGSGQVIPLTDNFRSRKGILDFVNSFFSEIVRPEIGGVAYDGKAQLRCGRADACKSETKAGPVVEWHWRLKSPNESEASPDEALAEIAELEEAAKEARLVALRLARLRAERYLVWDEAAASWRPVAWRDIAILLRAPGKKAESYAKEFARLGVPLQVVRRGFYDNLEISDLLSLFQLLDNPLQDLPLLAVLRSPLAGLSLDELATIRLAARGHFWSALMQYHDQSNASLTRRTDARKPKAPDALHQQELAFVSNTTGAKIALFLERYRRWRKLARQGPLSRCLDRVIAETHYAAWLSSQSRGEQRRANLRRLTSITEQFDRFQRQGLFRFLRFIEAQQAAQADPEVAQVAGENAVRLLSIHQSKGLEFPVVVVADLAKPFNLRDLSADIILDEEYGLCPQVQPPEPGPRYPSLPYWLARRRQTRELLGEEMRLMYVALTRARDLLLLSASVSASRFNKLEPAERPPTESELLAARSCSDWGKLWMARHAPGLNPGSTGGENAFFRWELHKDSELVAKEFTSPLEDEAEDAPAVTAADWHALHQKLSWQYPLTWASRQPAKTSVSALRRRAMELDEEANPARFIAQLNTPATPSIANRSATAQDRGHAHHTFLQQVSLGIDGKLSSLEDEAQRLQQEGLMKADETGLLDFKAMAAFFGSELGTRIRAAADFVHRELPFTARFSPRELARPTGYPAAETTGDADFVLVQGVADLAVILPAQIWLLDFKTDKVAARKIPERARLYEPQLLLYGAALAAIYKRPVTESWLYFLDAGQAIRVLTQVPAL